MVCLNECLSCLKQLITKNYLTKRVPLWALALLTIVFVSVIITLVTLLCHGIYRNQSKEFRRTDGEGYSRWRSMRFCVNYDSGIKERKNLGIQNNTVIVVSVSGLGPTQIDERTPALKRLVACGASPSYMRGSYPAQSLPNLYSIVTGLYPNAHGIVADSFLDPLDNVPFKFGSEKSKQNHLWAGLPVWRLAESIGMKTAAINWPGSDVPNLRPSYYEIYDKRTKDESRIDKLLKLLILPKNLRPSLLFLSLNIEFSFVSEAITNRHQISDNVRRIDGLIDRLMQGLYDAELISAVNLMVVSDYGILENVSCSKVITRNHYLQNIMTLTSNYKLRKMNDVLLNEIIRKINCGYKDVKVFKKDDIPIKYKYMENMRIGPIVVDVKDGYVLIDKLPKCNRNFENIDERIQYNARTRAAFFVAHGPIFRSKIQMYSFDNVELYNMIREIFNLPMKANNGTEYSLNPMLENRLLSITCKTGYFRWLRCPPDMVKHSRWTGIVKRSLQSQKKHKITIKNKYTGQRADVYGIQLTCFVWKTEKLYRSHDYIITVSRIVQVPLYAAYNVEDKTLENLSFKDDFHAKQLLDLSDIHSADLKYYQRNHIDLIELIPKELQTVSKSHRKHMQVPLFQDSNIWTNIMKKFIEERKTKNGNVNVITGPIYYYKQLQAILQKSDSVKGYIHAAQRIEWILRVNHKVPTHMFYIINFCNSAVPNIRYCSPRDLNISTFIFPNVRNHHKCYDKKDRSDTILREYMVQVKDIERLTGFRFFSTVQPFKEFIELNFYLPEL
ncbi:Uncharacterised protein g9363 [Pycnogonum litorale]